MEPPAALSSSKAVSLTVLWGVDLPSLVSARTTEEGLTSCLQNLFSWDVARMMLPTASFNFC